MIKNGIACLAPKAEKKQEEVSEEASYYSCERCFGTYSWFVSLAFPVDGDKISATLENGLLEMRLKKPRPSASKSRSS